MLQLKDIPLQSAPFIWFVAGGWALDLFLGKQTRQHTDMDLGVFRNHQLLLQHFLSGWSLSKAVNGKLLRWEEDEWLALPIHEIHCQSSSGQKIEILLSESDSSNWIYRRDSEITLPLMNAILEVTAGLQVLAPEIVLLFKSKTPREVDQADFDSILPRLSIKQINWLLTSIRSTNGSSRWVERLSQLKS